MKTGRFLALFLILSQCFSAAGQDVREEMARAGRLFSGYDFEGAAAIYNTLLKSETDSVTRARLQERVLLCENGMNLIRYANEPEVVLRRTFPVEEFYLYYSHLADGGWIASPNAFSSGKDPLYFEPGCRSLVFSAPDAEGRKTLYTTYLKDDGLWSVPEPAELCSSAGNEVFPLVSASGKELYFSSDALAGMGGYDLFVSRWNERRKRWEAPENLGFPYSSTGDDFLFSNTPDGEFTLLASNRDCGRDSMTIYVLRFENSPVSKAVSSPAEALRIASLIPSTDSNLSGSAGNASVGTAQNAAGSEAAFKRWKAALSRLEGARKSIPEAPTEELMMDLQRLAGRIADTVTRLELELIAAGGSPDYGKAASGGKVAPEPRKSYYAFVRHEPGTLSGIAFEKPAEEDDLLTFAIGNEGVVVNEFPSGIVFQIQLAVVSNKMSVKQLHGIKPVFAKRQNSGKYLYTAGAFRTYAEASAALPLVKKAGFPSAYIVAFKNGAAYGVSKARAETEQR